MEKERLAEHLERYHSGASNAATSRELECAFGVKGKELRDTVNALRRESVPIASNGSGYFYAATEQEVRATTGRRACSTAIRPTTARRATTQISERTASQRKTTSVCGML